MAATKPQLSREYVYVPFTAMNMSITALTTNALAFKTAGTPPEDIDWKTAIKVDAAHALYKPAIGESLALLVGPLRGDSVTTFDPGLGDWQVWVDAKASASDERVVRAAGILTINVGG